MHLQHGAERGNDVENVVADRAARALKRNRFGIFGFGAPNVLHRDALVAQRPDGYANVESVGGCHRYQSLPYEDRCSCYARSPQTVLEN